LKYLTNKNRAEGLPDCQKMRTAVMVAEIKQFYDKKNQKFTKQRSEQRTNEKLAEASNQFLELTSKIVHKYGGDILQFLGNSLIAIWPEPNPSNSMMASDYNSSQ